VKKLYFTCSHDITLDHF